MKEGDNSLLTKILKKIQGFNNVKLQKDDGSLNFNPINSIQDNRIPQLPKANLELSDIPYTFLLLYNNNDKTKLQSAEILNCIMSKLTSAQLIKVYKIFRNNNSYEWNYDWQYREPKDLLHALMSDEEKVTILGLCSFHPNGYFREKAIKALSKMRTGYEIPYFLIRINDWVKQVRDISKEKLAKYITPQYSASFVNYLPIVFRLRECSRDQHSDTVNSIISMLAREESSAALIKGLQSNDCKVRLCCYKIILKKRVLDNKRIINNLMKDTNSYNRLFVLRNIINEITSEEFTDIRHLLLNDKFAKIRIIALETMYKFKPEEAKLILEKSLFDRNQSVRQLSRYLLSRYDKYDFATIYRNSIQDNKQLYASICGIGEIGNIYDSKIITEYLNSDIISIVKGAIKAISKLDFQGYKDKIIKILNDERAGISKAAKCVLYKEIDNFDGEKIYYIYKQAIYHHVKINTCVLLCSLSKWEAIKYIIELCADNDESISVIGQAALENWKQKFNRSFISPSEGQIKWLSKTLIDGYKSISDSDREFIEFSIRDFEK